MEWPPDFQGELARRLELERVTGSSPEMIAAATAFYAQSLPAFVADCCWVYEPRNASAGDPVRLPVVLFERQRAFLEWMVDHYKTKSSAPVEKSRDSGATWMAAAFAVWMWLFVPGSSFGFGSRKEELVDRAGDMNSIFEKVRSIVRNLPWYLVPEGFSEKTHSNFRRLLNPANEAAIVGEAGANIGRGGRTTVYVVDESAFVEQAESIEAALSATTDVRIDISSPQAGSLFTHWCNGTNDKFIFDVTDVPWHTPDWIARKKREFDAKGLGHLFRREFLRDATAGIAGQLISSDWVEASVGAAEKLGISVTGAKIASLDVADGGADLNSLAIGRGIEVDDVRAELNMLADQAGKWALGEALRTGCTTLRYDSVGVGAGAAAALREAKGIEIDAFNGGACVVAPKKKYPDDKGGRTNEDTFANLKAQSWWLLRDRFIATFRAVTTGVIDDPDMLISLNPGITDLRELKSELTQITYGTTGAGKTIINKTPPGTRSPNRADAVMMRFAVQKPKFAVIGVF